MTIKRLAHGPIIYPELDASIGTNINGPSLIRVPDWLPDRLGTYYLYFGHHQGKYIRLAYADRLEGPWTIYKPGTLQLKETRCHGHVASPDVHIDNANQRGLKITANQYPYLAGGTRFSSVLIPAWVRADSREAMFDRLKNRDLQDRIHEEMIRNLNRRGGPNTMLVTSNKSPWRGMFLNEIAEIMKLDVLDAAIEIIKEGDPSIASFMINENDLHVFATQNWSMTGSDGSEGHPRKYATYPKVFQDMVLKERLFSLEKFVYRSSGLVADTFNLCDRGYLEEGRKADIIVLDLERFTPLANFEDPTLLSTGVIHAMVNGKQVITHEQFTEELPGVVINRQKINCEDNEIQ